MDNDTRYTIVYKDTHEDYEYCGHLHESLERAIVGCWSNQDLTWSGKEIQDKLTVVASYRVKRSLTPSEVENCPILEYDVKDDD